MLIVQTWPIERLIEYARNPRKNDEHVERMAGSIREFGFRIPVVAKSDGTVVDGHLRLKAARRLGLVEVPVALADELTEGQIKAFRLLANRSATWAEWDDDLLRSELGDLRDSGFDLALTGFGDEELAALFADRTAGLTDPDDVPEAPAEPVTQPGDVWLLGRHRLMCGDSTQRLDVERLLAGVKPDCVLTDPPYCSGGFQEAGRAMGSIGSDGAKHGKDGQFAGGVANDKLSTRGYIALMKSVFGLCQAPMIYVFTDWRMWINLYDVAESSGYGVRNMIVWDKGTPGMGRGWRTQHELVLYGAKAAVAFDNHKAQGNVIASKRTGNPLHPTQKPVDLLESILDVSDMAGAIYDPFCGSGTTVIAAETVGRRAFLMELMPTFADTAILRWQAFTGQTATRLDGTPFAAPEAA